MTRGALNYPRGRSAPSFSFVRALIAPGCVLACALLARDVRAAVAFVNAVNGAATNTAASYTITPVAATAGNVLVAHIALGGNTVPPTGPAGWTRQTFSTSVTGAVVVSSWTYTVTTTGAYAFTWNTAGPSGGWAGSILQYSGVDTFCPVGGVGTTAGTTTNSKSNPTFPIPVITVLANGGMLSAGYAHLVKNKTFTPAAGFTTRGLSKSNTNNSPSCGSSDRTQAVAGPSTTGNVRAKNADLQAFACTLVELDPAETTGVTLAPAAMSFSSNQGVNPPAQTFTITNSHQRAACPNQTYTASVGSFSAGWSAANLPAPNVTGVNLAKGAVSAAISVSVNATALPSGTYTAVITITDAAGNLATIDVTLSVACVVAREPNVATNAATAATALTLTEPAGWTDGDQLVAALLADTTTAPAAPAGWTLVGSNTTGGALGMWIYRAPKAGPATATWTGFASGRLAGVMAAYLNANSIALLDAPPVPFTPATTASGDGAVDVNACTTVGGNASVIAAYGINATSAGTTLTPGAGLTSVSGDVSTGAAAGDITLNVGSDLLIPPAGTPLSENGAVAPAQAAPKLGALCTLGAANTPPAVTVLRSPVLPSQGDTVTYTILVTNPAGNQPIPSLVMSDTLPANLTFVSLTADAAGAGLTLSNNPGTGNVQGAYGTLTTPLAAGASVAFTLVGSLACGVTGAQSSTVTAETPGTCGTPVRVLNAFLPGVVSAPIVSMTRTPVAPVQGDYVTYAIVVTNNNALAPLNALTVSDTLPAGVTFVSLAADAAGAGLALSANPGAGTVQGASGQLTSPLAAGNSVTFTLVGKIGCTETLAQTSRAYAETAQGCQKAVTGADTFTPGTVTTPPTVSVLRSPAAPAQGDAVSYMIVVRNPAGNAGITSLVVSDTLPAGIEVTLFEGGSDGAGDGLTLSSDLGTGTVQGAYGYLNSPLAAGASFTFTVTGAVSCAATGLQTHQAYAEIAGGCLTGLSVANTLTLSGSAMVVASVAPACGSVAGGFTMTITGTFGTGTCVPTTVAIGPDLAVILGTPTTSKILVTVPVFTGTGTGSTQDVVVAAAAGTAQLGASYIPFATNGALSVAGSVRPRASIGQWFTVALTVTNTGGAPVTGVTPAVAVAPGAALVAVQSSPAGGLTLAAGAATTFEWTYSASGAGVVTWTMSVAGTRCDGGALLSAASVSATMQAPAAIAAGVFAPATVCTGDNLLVTVTVTNTGGADALGVTPVQPAVAGPGGATFLAGPTPASVASLPGGGMVTFTYTFTAGTTGNVFFTATVTALDANTGLSVASGPVTSAAAAVTTPGALAASLAVPPAAPAGQWFTVALTVTNAGGAAATGVSATAIAGSALATWVSGPVPAGPVSLGAGSAQTFVWTFSANGTAGVEAFTATATGLTCAATPLLVAATTTLTIGSAAQLVVQAASYGDPLCVGDGTLVTVTVTNTGGTAANTVTPHQPLALGAGGAAYAAGPNPAAPVSLSPGASVTFTYTFTASSSGLLFFSSSVSGQDALTSAALSAGPALAATLTVVTPGALAASASVRPLASVGQWFAVALTVTNTGGADVTGITPAVAVGPGAALVNPEASPAGGVTLAPGAAASFVWTYSAGGAGPVTFTLSAAGATCAASVVNASALAAITLQTPAALVMGAPLAAPDPLCQGAEITLALTVTNAGQADAVGVAGLVAPAGTASWLVISAPAPLTLPGGSATVLVWTFDAADVGGLGFTVTVTGADGNSGALLAPAPASSNTITITSAGFLVATTAAPATVSVGQWFTVALTVTNAGDANVNNIVPSIHVGPGSPLVTAQGSPPASEPALLSGTDVTFVWTYSANGSGPVTFTVTAAGTACAVTPMIVAAITPVLIQTPAALDAALAAFPSPRTVGQSFLAMLTVTNTGEASAVNVTPGILLPSGAGGASVDAGPTPAAPVALAGGASITFTWTLTAASSGTVFLSSTVTGSDGNSGLTTGVGPVISNPVLIQTPAALAAALHVWSGTVCLGSDLTVTLTVTNTGEAAATGVTAAALQQAGAGALVDTIGALAAGAPLAGGSAVTFTWTLTAAAPGPVSFSATVTAIDANDGSAEAALPTSPSGLIVDPGALTAAVASPAVVSTGQWFTLSVTVTNTGSATVTGITPDLAPGPLLEAQGAVAPAGPQTLNAGAAVTFVWTYSASGAGAVSFTATAAGTSLCGPILGAAPGSLTIQSRADLGAWLVAGPTPRDVGQPFLVTLTVSNAGQAAGDALAVAGLTPFATAGLGSSAGPWPVVPGTIAGGTTLSFTWTVSGAAAGFLGLTATVSGADANSGAGLGVAPVVSNTVFIQTPAALAVSGPTASPDPLCQGARITVTLAVTNTGQADAVNVGGAIAFAGSGSALSVSAPGSLTLAGGAATVFVWTYDAGNAGGLGFTVTVTGADGNTAAVLAPAPTSSNTITVTSAGYLAGAAAAPLTVSVGQWFTVTLTVTNGGGADVTGVTPAVAAGPGSALVTAQGGAPSPVPVLASGAAVAFVWTYSANGSGPVTFTLTASGIACGGPVDAAASAAVTIQTPAALGAALAAFPSPRTIGQAFLATLTVTNTGEADATNVTPAGPLPFGIGGASVDAGPVPAAPVTLAGGASITFTWTLTAASSGTVFLSSTVTGGDGNSGLPVGAGPVLSGAVLIQTPAALAGALHRWSTTVCLGADLTVTLTVTNTGGAGAVNVMPAALVQSGAGALTDAGTPAGLAFLSGGDAVTFTWTLTGATAGFVSFSTTVTASDANDASPEAAPVAAGPVQVVDAGVLAVSVAAPAVVSAGQWFAVSLTVTNTGSAAVTGLLPELAAGPSLELQGSVAPAGPQTLNAGAAVTFAWTYSASGAGVVTFTATASGSCPCGPMVNAATASLTVQSRADLGAWLVAGPTPRNVGQPFTVTLTVTNAGQADAGGFDASGLLASGSAGVGSAAGPWPAIPAVLPGGSSLTFTWTYTGSSAGMLDFTTTVTAADANSGAGIVVGPVASGSVLIQTPAALAVSGPSASPDPLCQGARITVTLAVTNTGQADAVNVGGAIAVAGTGSAVPVSAPGALTLAGGAATVFVWTYDAGNAGGLGFTITVTGADGSTAAVLAPAPASSNTITVTSAGYLAGAAAAPLTVSTGQWFAVTFTVTNAGGAPVTAVTPDVAASGASVTAQGAGPAPVPSLAAGASVAFVWTYSANGSGPVTFSLTASGIACGGPVDAAATAAVTLQTPAAFGAALAAFPSPRTIGQAFLATLTVTNTGEADAVNVAPGILLPSGAGGASVDAGPVPAAPVTLAGGASITFTWTLTAASSGTVFLSSTVTGGDGNSGLTTGVGPVLSTPVLVQAPAALAAAAHVWSSTVCLGANLRVTVTVTNTGEAAANGVAVAGLLQAGPGALTDAGTPAGLPVLSGGDAVTFTWTLTGATAGFVSFSTTVTAADANDGTVLSGAIASAGSALVVDSGVLVAAVAAPATVSTGQWFGISLTVTNTGSAAVTGLLPELAAGPLLELQGSVAPAGPQTLNAGAAVTFAWTYSASGAGVVAFTATAGGASLCGPIQGAANGALTVQTRAALAASLVPFPSPRVPGQPATLTLTVTNTGQAAADLTALPAVAVAGGAFVDGGPAPAPPLTLAGGAAVTFTWTVSTTAAGPVSFSVTVPGTDAVSGAPVDLLVATAAPLVVSSGSSLVITATTSVFPVAVGQQFTVNVKVANAGGVSAVGVSATLSSSSSSVMAFAFPPMSATIVSGGDYSFQAALTAVTSGDFSLTITVTGVDAVSGDALQEVFVYTFAGAFINPPPAVVAAPSPFTPGATAAGAEIFPLPFRPATGPLRFTKLPADSRVRIYTVAGALVRELDADARGVVEWDGANADGSAAVSAVYFYVIQPPSGAKHVGKLEIAR